MAKKGFKINPTFVPVPGEVRQGLLFADARTAEQAAVLAAADGTRNLAAIAAQCKLSREACEKALTLLIAEGDLRPASNDELLEGAERLRVQGRLEGAVQLLQHLVESGGGLPAEERLAELLGLCARRKESAAVYNRLSATYTQAGRLGEALSAARRAAELQPGNWQLQNALAELSLLTGRSDEAARVWRAYARRLAGAGSFEQALGIIDTAQKQLAGNDILFYAEAEVLSAQERAHSGVSAVEAVDTGTIGTLSQQVRAFSHPQPLPQEGINESAPDQEAAAAPETHSGERAAVADSAGSVTETGSMPTSTVGVHAFVAAAVQAREAAGLRRKPLLDLEALDGEKEGATDTFASSYVPPHPTSERVSTGAYAGQASGREVTPRPRRRGRSLVSAAYILGGAVVFLAILASIYDYHSREQMRRAADMAALRLSVSAKEALYRKLIAADLALQELQAQEPFWDFIQSTEYSQQMERVRVFKDTVQKELAVQRKKQKASLEHWQSDPSEKNIGVLQELMEQDDPDSPAVRKAKELYWQWQQKQSRRPSELQKSLHTLQDRSRSVVERFTAYQTLVLDHGYAFLRDYEEGCRNLSVPVEINVYCGRNRETLPFSVFADGRELGRPLELPLDPEADLVLAVNGFRVAEVGADVVTQRAPVGRLSIPRPFTRQQTYIMEKAERWSQEVAFTPTRCLISPSGQQVLVAGGGEYTVLRTEDGQVLSTGRLQPTSGDSDANRDELATAGDWGLYLSGGRLAAFRLDAGGNSMGGADAAGMWQSPDNAVLSAVSGGRLAGDSAAEQAIALVSVRSGTLAGNAEFWSGRPVQAVAVESGKTLWPPEPTDEIAAAGHARLLDWRVAYVDVRGRLQIRLESGGGAQTLPLPGVSSTLGAGRGGARFFSIQGMGSLTERGSTLLLLPQIGGLSAFQVRLAGEAGVSPLWQIKGDYGAWMQVREGAVWLRGVGVESWQLADGKLLARYERSGGLSCDPALLPGRLIVGGARSGKLDDRGGLLLAIREDGGVPSGVLWDYELPQRPAALSAWERGREARIACVSGRKVFLFDD